MRYGGIDLKEKWGGLWCAGHVPYHGLGGGVTQIYIIYKKFIVQLYIVKLYTFYGFI